MRPLSVVQPFLVLQHQLWPACFHSLINGPTDIFVIFMRLIVMPASVHLMWFRLYQSPWIQSSALLCWVRAGPLMCARTKRRALTAKVCANRFFLPLPPHPPFVSSLGYARRPWQTSWKCICSVSDAAETQLTLLAALKWRGEEEGKKMHIFYSVATTHRKMPCSACLVICDCYDVWSLSK